MGYLRGQILSNKNKNSQTDFQRSDFILKSQSLKFRSEVSVGVDGIGHFLRSFESVVHVRTASVPWPIGHLSWDHSSLNSTISSNPSKCLGLEEN